MSRILTTWLIIARPGLYAVTLTAPNISNFTIHAIFGTLLCPTSARFTTVSVLAAFFKIWTLVFVAL